MSMNYTSIEDDGDDEDRLLMMSTYDKLLRLRNVLETDTFEAKDEPTDLIAQLEKHKIQYLNLLTEVIEGYSKLGPKKDKAGLLYTFVNKFGNDDIKYVQDIKTLVQQFEEDEKITEIAKELKEKSERLLGMKKVFELCGECDILSNYMCFLCLDRPVKIFIDPCGHVMCRECSLRGISVCPFCRRNVSDFKTMFIT